MSAGGLRFGLYEICKEPNCDVWGVERVEGEWPFFAESSEFLQEGHYSFDAILGVEAVR